MYAYLFQYLRLHFHQEKGDKRLLVLTRDCLANVEWNWTKKEEVVRVSITQLAFANFIIALSVRLVG